MTDGATGPRARRYLALHLPHFATERRRRDSAFPADRPLASVHRVGASVMVTAVCPQAAACGLAPGMTLAGARAMVPELAAAHADPAADAAGLEALALWAERFTPLPAVDPGGDGLMLDVTGCTHLFGGEAALLDVARDRLAGLGLTVRAALAGTPGAAGALARWHRDGAHVPADAVLAESLAPLPVAALTAADPALPTETLDGLARVGLRRLGDLYALPRAALAARFGLAAAGALDRLLGRVAQPLAHRRAAPPHRVRLGFPDPIGTQADVAAALDRLLARLAERLTADQRGGRRFELAAVRADGTAARLEVGTARPVRDPAHLARLFAERLERLDPGHGIDSLVLAATATEPWTADQGGFAPTAAGAGDASALPALVDRLTARLGGDAVMRLAPVDSRLPDRAQRAVPAGTAPGGTGWPRTPPRPLRLETTPAPATVTEDAEGQPARLVVGGRGRTLHLAAGPERIAPDWWRRDPAWTGGTRDYWRVEDETGRRRWLYRETASGRWLRHGTW